MKKLLVILSFLFLTGCATEKIIEKEEAEKWRLME